LEDVCPGCLNEELKLENKSWYQSWYESALKKFKQMGYNEIPHFCIKKWESREKIDWGE